MEYERERSSTPVLEQQEKVLIVTRRLFSGDLRRHFVGTVERYDRQCLRVRGYEFVYDIRQSGYVRRRSPRTRVFPLDNHIVVFVLPEETEIGAVVYATANDVGLIATDRKHFQLELSEFQH